MLPCDGLKMSDHDHPSLALTPAPATTPARRLPLRRLGAAALILGLSQGLGGIVRDCALTCNVGYRQAPIAFLLVAALGLPLVALQLRMQRSWGHELWRKYSILFIVVILFAFRLLLGLFRVDVGATAASAKLTYLGFFVWVDLAFMLLAAQLFSLLQG